MWTCAVKCRKKLLLRTFLFLLIFSAFFYLTSVKLKFLTNDEEAFVYKNSCNFITHFHQGFAVGLGNRMFSYATLYGLAKINGKTPILHKFNYQIKDHFQSLSVEEVDYSLERFEADDDNDVCCKYRKSSTRLDCSKNITLNGYRISYKYFDKYRDEIKREFRFKENIQNHCENVMNEIRQNFTKRNVYDCVMIGAHMRRGDFLNKANEKKGYVPANAGYLHNAVDYFDKKFSRSKCRIFIVLGNDYEWNVRNSPKRNDLVVLTPSIVPTLDMCILSMCNGTIMTTGTFGWWGAYLAGGPTTYMKTQCVYGSDLCAQTNVEDFINPNWNWTAL